MAFAAFQGSMPSTSNSILLGYNKFDGIALDARGGVWLACRGNQIHRKVEYGEMAKGFAKFFMIAGIALVACAQEKPKQAEPVKPSSNSELPPGDSPGLPVDPTAYKLGPEDVIAIRVWRDVELSGQYVVRPDGKINLPLAGELKVSDHSPAEVQAKVIELYSKFINRPEISVSLTRVGSKKYYLVGKLLRTGTFPLVVPTTILEAINGAGGFQEFANQKKVTILRGDKRLTFNYKDVIKGKNMQQNIQIENGDHIVVD